MNRRAFIKSIGFSMTALTTRIHAASDRRSQPNIVLIMADDIGYECFGSYGSKQYKTPRLDALAAEGVMFTHCHSNPLCTPSRVKIMTGRSNIYNYVDFGVLRKTEKTFGNMFKEAGYKTCVAGKWQLKMPDNRGQTPKDAGFDSWCLWNIPGSIGNRYWKPNLQINGENKSFDQNIYGPDVCCDFLISFIKNNRQSPFFAYYPMILPHNPFLPTPDSSDRKNRNQQKNFEDMTSYIDKLVGRIADALDKLDLLKNTVLIFTSDNGTNSAIVSKLHGKKIVGGKGFTHRYGTHVPLIVSCPGTVKKGEVCDNLVDFSDIVPTLSDITGIPLLQDMKPDGLSFWPHCIGKQGKTHDYLFCYYFPRPGSGKYDNKYFHYEERFAWDKRFRYYEDGRLYDMIKDPEEKTNIRESDRNDEAEAARKKLKAAIDSMPEKGIATKTNPESGS